MPTGIYIRTKKRGGWHHSEEVKRKISEKMKGKKNCLGYKQTEEHKQKISKTWFKKGNNDWKKNLYFLAGKLGSLKGENHPCWKGGKKFWKQSNKEYIKEYRKRYYKKNLNARIALRLRRRIQAAFERKSYSKFGKTFELLGIDIYGLIRYLEQKFKENMTWENYGRKGWHIDHIIPIASFDLSKKENQQKAFHFTNLQPLWAEENLKKRKKYVILNLRETISS